MALQTKNTYLTSTKAPLSSLEQLTEVINLKLMGDTPITKKQVLAVLTLVPLGFMALLLATAAILLI